MTLPYKLGEDDLSAMKRVVVEVPIDEALQIELEDIWRADMSQCEILSARLITDTYENIVNWVKEYRSGS